MLSGLVKDPFATAVTNTLALPGLKFSCQISVPFKIKTKYSFYNSGPTFPVKRRHIVKVGSSVPTFRVT